MRARLVLALGAAALVAGVAAPSHAAGPPTLDGKKVKKLTGKAAGGVADHDADNASLDTPNRAACTMPRCYRLDFIYNPAKGVTGNVLFRITWTNPASDFDLYVADAKNTQIAACATAGGTGEQLVLRGKQLKPGKKYSLVADIFRSANDTVNATVEFPTKAVAGTTFPSDAEVLPVNCALDGSQ
jgi:hypothetical protein